MLANPLIPLENEGSRGFSLFHCVTGTVFLEVNDSWNLGGTPEDLLIREIKGKKCQESTPR
jgi:hypothetical protein